MHNDDAIVLHADLIAGVLFPENPFTRHSEKEKKRLTCMLGTGRMPHPVGGAMGVTLSHCREN